MTHGGEQIAEPPSPSACPTGRVLMKTRLFPHRSMSKKNAQTVLLIMGIVCLLAAIRFILAGAWPVVLFVAVDIAAIWLAFHLSFRSARASETLTLTDTDLVLKRTHPSGSQESWRFEPYWAKIWIEDTDNRHQLMIASNGEPVCFGAFLLPDEKQGLARSVRSALSKWRRQGFVTRQ